MRQLKGLKKNHKEENTQRETWNTVLDMRWFEKKLCLNTFEFTLQSWVEAYSLLKLNGFRGLRVTLNLLKSLFEEGITFQELT